MALKKLKPTTPGQRHAILLDRRNLHKGEPYKGLVASKSIKAGRNNRGVITIRHRGGGVKNKYRIIDLKRDKANISAKVETIEFDPNRSSFIALVKYADGERRYILAPDGIKIGSTIMSGMEAPVKLGNSMPLKKVPQGMFVHAVEMWPGKGATIGRSAGTAIQVMGGDKGYVQIKLPSGEYRLVNEECYATIGTLSNPDQKNIKLGKAGRKRRLGIKPGVRGVAMSLNHSHAGGQGKSGRHGTGGPAKDKWGNKIGKRTRKNRKVTGKFIIKRRASKNKFKTYKTII